LEDAKVNFEYDMESLLGKDKLDRSEGGKGPLILLYFPPLSDRFGLLTKSSPGRATDSVFENPLVSRGKEN